MNKGEMIEAIQRGEKVTHHYFTRDEYMTKGTQGGIMFEDGCQTTLWEFFRTRTDDVWLTGWSIWHPQK